MSAQRINIIFQHQMTALCASTHYNIKQMSLMSAYFGQHVTSVLCTLITKCSNTLQKYIFKSFDNYLRTGYP